MRRAANGAWRSRWIRVAGRSSSSRAISQVDPKSGSTGSLIRKADGRFDAHLARLKKERK